MKLQNQLKLTVTCGLRSGHIPGVKAVFFRANARLVKAMGGKDAFDAEVVWKFPLPLGNDAILEIAESFGWSDTFMDRPQPKLRTLPPPPRPNHDVGQMMLRTASSKAPAAAGPPLASRPAGPRPGVPIACLGASVCQGCRCSCSSSSSQAT